MKLINKIEGFDASSIYQSLKEGKINVSDVVELVKESNFRSFDEMPTEDYETFEDNDNIIGYGFNANIIDVWEK